MNKYRLAAVALAACAASLSLAACSAGITTAGPATTVATSSATTSASASSSPAAAGRMLGVSGKVSSFPVPAGAKVAENISISNSISVMFGKVTLAKVHSFYTQALPKAGDTITSDSSASGPGGIMIIQFTGHGYKGQVSTLASVPDPKDVPPGLGSKNVTAVLLQPK